MAISCENCYNQACTSPGFARKNRERLGHVRNVLPRILPRMKGVDMPKMAGVWAWPKSTTEIAPEEFGNAGASCEDCEHWTPDRVKMAMTAISRTGICEINLEQTEQGDGCFDFEPDAATPFSGH